MGNSAIKNQENNDYKELLTLRKCGNENCKYCKDNKSCCDECGDCCSSVDCGMCCLAIFLCSR